MSWNSGIAEIVSNTSPLLYLHRIQVIEVGESGVGL